MIARAARAHPPEPGADAPEAFDAMGTSSDGAITASGSDARLETVPPLLLPAQAFAPCYSCALRYHAVVAGATCTQMDRVGAAMVQQLRLHAELSRLSVLCGAAAHC